MRRALGGLVAAAVLAGCGPGAAEQANRYADAVNRAQTRFSRSMDQLSNRISASSNPDTDRRVLHEFDTAIGRVVGDLRRVEPPGRVAALHRQLVGEMGRYGSEIRRETEVLRSGDSRRLVAAQQRLLKATTTVSNRINATIASINKRLKNT